MGGFPARVTYDLRLTTYDLIYPLPLVMMTDLLALLNWEPPTVTKQKKKSPPKTAPQPRRKKIDLSLNYSAFDDDYFWELIRKDYSSAWRYVDRMTKTLSS